MEAAFNLLLVILGMGFVGGIAFTIARIRSGRTVMPDFRVPLSVNPNQTSEQF